MTNRVTGRRLLLGIALLCGTALPAQGGTGMSNACLPTTDNTLQQQLQQQQDANRAMQQQLREAQQARELVEREMQVQVQVLKQAKAHLAVLPARLAQREAELARSRLQLRVMQASLVHMLLTQGVQAREQVWAWQQASEAERRRAALAAQLVEATTARKVAEAARDDVQAQLTKQGREASDPPCAGSEFATPRLSDPLLSDDIDAKPSLTRAKQGMSDAVGHAGFGRVDGGIDRGVLAACTP